jgi:hypothetical protein
MDFLNLLKGRNGRMIEWKIVVSLVLIILLALASCTIPKKVFYFKEPTPPHMWCEKASQAMVDYPPFLRPEGKRRGILILSQYFTLAIPNAIDKSGRAQDLQRSLADMLYTKLFERRRFNLLDRRELVEIDPEWLETSIKSSLTDLSKESTGEKQIGDKTSKKSDKATSMLAQTIEYLNRREKGLEKLEKVLKKADGILLVYITSRIGTKKGGSFFVDYRIVNQWQTQGHGNEIILFADSKEVKYRSSTTQEVEYDRRDIDEISLNIVNVFPNPHTTKKSEIVKRDGIFIVINIGKDDGIIPGLRGYVVHCDDILIEHDRKELKAQHYTYLAEFTITEVFDKTSTGILLYPKYGKLPENFDWDIRVGDPVVIK